MDEHRQPMASVGIVGAIPCGRPVMALLVSFANKVRRKPVMTGFHNPTLDLIKQMLYNITMDMYVALADPTRRHILELLATNGELSATAIYEQFPVSPQAISQHLKVLREAHLVEMEKRAQKHVYRLNPQTLSQFEAWVQQMQQRWSERFDTLDTVLESEKKKKGE
jgi:DNA-binding transcriptional ArsR family regulator